MPSVGSIASTAGSGGTAALLTGLGAVGGPVGFAIGAGVGALITLVSDIGSGRRTANKFTQNGGPQDIINKQLAAISASSASPAEKQQATHDAWTGFIQAANQFASQGKEQAQVAKQAIYQTPALTQTVASLGGFNPLSDQYTSQVSPSIPGATPQSGVSWKQFIAPTLAAAGGAALGSSLAGSGTVGQAAQQGALQNADQSLTPEITAYDPLAGGVATQSIPPADSLGATYGVDFGGAGSDIPLGGAGAASNILPGATFAGGAAPFAGAASSAAAGGTSLLSRLFPSLISGGTSLLSGAIGASAAKNAAQVQADAELKAAQLAAQTGANSLDFQKQVLAQQQANAQPWIDAGTGALKQIGDITSTPYTLPTAEEARNTPGYQFALDQGQKAIDAYEKASGFSLSGKAVKDVNNYAQGTADTNYQNVVGNSIAARNANLNPLLSVAGLGQLSDTSLNSNLGQAANLNANTNEATTGAVNNANTSAAAATASGYIGSANSWLNSVGNIGNQFTQSATPSAQTIAQVIAAMNKLKAA